jgi:hypothetical protein
MKAESIETVINFIEKQGIKVFYGTVECELNRIIKFTVEDIDYYIEWWVNQSFLRFKNDSNSACLPFKYIGAHNYSPTTKHRWHLCFYDEKVPNKDQFMYSEIPFGALRIPFNK